MRTVACLTIALGLGGWAVGRPTVAPVSSAPARPYGVAEGRTAGPHVSATSCSAAACHGGGQPGRPGSEHTTWAPDLSRSDAEPQDPHARAYRVLYNPVSTRMSELLQRGPAYQDELCLKCHAPGGVHNEAARAEGVGCADCHGPADKWLTSHYEPAWKALSNREKGATGFIPTKSLVARAANCASCHVGDASRDVNHDLIAAGHPRLSFEYTRFHFHPTYQKHWAERTPQPAFESRAWAVGQVASLRAAVEVLRARADKSSQGPWPEFAGYSCYACHQAVGGGEPRGPGAASVRKLGAPGWEVWYTAAIEPAGEVAAAAFPGVAKPAVPAVEELQKLMNGQQHPPRARVIELATRALGELDGWLAAVQQAEDGPLPVDLPLSKLGRSVAGHALTGPAGGKLRDNDWDYLATHYLGAAALHHAEYGAAAGAERGGTIRALDRELRFPIGGSGYRFDSPGAFDRARVGRVEALFGRLFEGRYLPAPGGAR